MRHIKTLSLLLFVVLASCGKDKDKADIGCVTLPNLTTTQLAQTDIDKVNLFLKTNNITATFVPQSYYPDSVYTYGRPGKWNFNYKMTGYQVVNKLPILNGLVFWQDRVNATQYGLYPRVYENFSLDPTARSTARDIKKAYIEIISKLYDPFRTLPNTPYSDKHYEDSCLTIKYGYYDLSANGYYLNPPNMVRAWEVTPKSGIPLIRINDDTKTFISGTYPENLHIE